jgi:hypothetical protein
MSYVTLAIPASLVSIAHNICVAFEPDLSVNTAHYNAFVVRCAGAGASEYLAYGSDVSDQIAASVGSWKANASSLHGAVVATYSERWPKLTPPSLADVEQFCDAVLISAESDVLAGLAELGLSISLAAEV